MDNESKRLEDSLVEIVESREEHKWRLESVKKAIGISKENLYRASALLFKDAELINKSRGMGFGLHEHYVALAGCYFRMAERKTAGL